MASTTPTGSTSSSSSSSSQPPAAPAATTTSTSVKRACDACHRRKVKCDGLSPCRNCSSAQLACTYNAIPQKKGPKGSRAKVISELREQNRQSALSHKAHARLLGLNAAAAAGGLQSPPLCAPSLAPTPGLLTPELIAACIDFFFVNMYPSCPILHRGKLEAQARFADRDLDTYCLLTSLCAFMMIQPGMPVPGDPMGLDSMPGANVMSGTMLMEETIRCRKGYDHLEAPTLGSLATSYFLYGCYFGLDIHTKAWFHLREATTLAHILGMNKEETYMTHDVIDSSRRRRLYWLLFVTERCVFYVSIILLSELTIPDRTHFSATALSHYKLPSSSPQLLTTQPNPLHLSPASSTSLRSSSRLMTNSSLSGTRLARTALLHTSRAYRSSFPTHSLHTSTAPSPRPLSCASPSSGCAISFGSSASPTAR